MDHSGFKELLSAFADGELTPAQQEAVELHVVDCLDCQRNLAEFRLTRRQLALLADPKDATWRPDVVARVTKRIQKRRRWMGFGRRLVSGAVRALAAGAILVAAIWLLQRFPRTSSEDDGLGVAPVAATQQASDTPVMPALQFGSSTPTLIPTLTGQPTPGVLPSTYLALADPEARVTLHVFGADLLLEAPAAGAINNLGYRLSADDGAFAIVEIVGGEQIALNPDEIPSIFVPASARSGDRVLLFAATPYGRVSPAAEFTVISVADGWQAQRLRQVDTTPALRVGLATPTPQVFDLFSPPSLSGQEVALRFERLYVTPEQPRQGQPFTITAVIRNLAEADARAPVWFSAFRIKEDIPVRNSVVLYLIVPAGGETEISWEGEGDGWNSFEDVSRENARLIFSAGVNTLRPGGYNFPLQPEDDKHDNTAEIAIDFLPYEPLVSDACAPSDNLSLSLDSTQIYRLDTRERTLVLVVRNDGDTEVARVPLRAIDATDLQVLTNAQWVPPCGGMVKVDQPVSFDELTYPITLTLNPADAPDALLESDLGDNTLVVSATNVCTGTTDLWVTADDVVVDGDDLLVTIHLSGSLPRSSFFLTVYHTDEGRRLANAQVQMTACEESFTTRFEGILIGLQGGFVMVQIDTEAHRSESFYPQRNNTAIAPLP